jgi:hypothetical protein
MRRLAVSVAAGVVLVAAIATPRLPYAQTSTRVPIGTNLSGVDDWSTEFSFVDVFKQSRVWFSGSATVWQDARPIDLDAHGWVRSLQPGQVARTLMFWDLSRAPGQYPGGRYVVTYDGEGSLGYAASAGPVQRQPGREVIDVNPARGGGLGLFITSTNPANYIRNIHVIPQWLVDSPETFNPALLDRISRYRVIRFMNWMLGQNNNQIMQTHWSERPAPDDAQWTSRGVPVEIMVQLANRIHADAWFSIPHLADDDYVRHFAAVVASQLDPDLKVYVEHSNEVWNGGYPQAAYARQRGLELALSTNAGEAQIRYHALRSRQIFGIFEEVLPRERLVRVLGSFVANPSVTTTALAFGDTSAHVDAIAVAPYFGILPNDLGRVQRMSVSDLMRDLESNSIPTVMNQVRQHVSIGRTYGLPVIAYEGGQSLGTSGGGALQGDATLEALFDAVNRDPGFGILYSRYLQAWQDAGAGLFIHYSNCFGYGPFGRFGSLEYIDQPRETAPKYDALQRWIEGR